MGRILRAFFTVLELCWESGLIVLFYTCAAVAFVSIRIADWAETTARWTWTLHARRIFAKMHEAPYH